MENLEQKYKELLTASIECRAKQKAFYIAKQTKQPEEVRQPLNEAIQAERRLDKLHEELTVTNLFS